MGDDRYDLVVIGAGEAGLAAAEFAAGLDLRVALVERDRIGGAWRHRSDLPSKALVAAARTAHTLRRADRFGLPRTTRPFDLAAVWAAAREAVDAEPDDPRRPGGIPLGVELVRGTARISGPNEVAVRDGTGAAGSGSGGPADGPGDERVLPTRFVLVCTGSRPALPDLEGLADVPFLTTDDLIALDAPPPSLLVLGAGSAGVETAQALARLGVAVTLLEQAPSILPRDEPAVVERLACLLRDEGLVIETGVVAQRVEGDRSRVALHGLTGGVPRVWNAAGLLVATGRRAEIGSLGLGELGIAVGPHGIEVDDRNRTAVRSIYAAGDVTGRAPFSHIATRDAVRAVRDAFFPGSGRVDTVVPRCTFTDPECAHVGPTVAEAEARYGNDADVWRVDLAELARSRIDRAPAGLMVIVTAKGRVVGAHVLAPHASEIVHELALAVRHELRLDDLAALAHLSPTWSAAIGRVAAEATTEKAQKLRFLVRRR